MGLEAGLGYTSKYVCLGLENGCCMSGVEGSTTLEDDLFFSLRKDRNEVVFRATR